MISIKNLSITYNNKDSFTVDEVDFKEGEINSIVGRNGSGKSTILRAMAGQLKYKGEILIDGKSLKSYSSMNRAKLVAYLPQSVKSANLDVRSLVEHGRYAYLGNFRKLSSEDNRCVDRALEITHMKDYEDRNLKEISLGERQKAFLAMVIAQNSKMILLDEPTTYMDLVNQKEFYEIMNTLTSEGVGIVMVCHDIEQSLSFSDRVYVMEKGHLISAGTPDDIVNNEDLMRRNFGVAIKKNEDEDLLHPYLMIK